LSVWCVWVIKLLDVSTREPDHRHSSLIIENQRDARKTKVAEPVVLDTPKGSVSWGTYFFPVGVHYSRARTRIGTVFLSAIVGIASYRPG